MPSKAHIHSYAKLKGRPGYFKCTAPDCSHYSTKELIRGKYSMCECSTKFIIDSENIKLAVLRCLNCRNTKVSRAFKVGQELMGRIVNFDIGDGAKEPE